VVLGLGDVLEVLRMTLPVSFSPVGVGPCRQLGFLKAKLGAFISEEGMADVVTTLLV